MCHLADGANEEEHAMSKRVRPCCLPAGLPPRNPGPTTDSCPPAPRPPPPAPRFPHPLQIQRKLMFAVGLAAVFMVVEIVGGIYAHSLAIITDAAHLFSDVSGFAVALLAAYWAKRRSRGHFSYGYHRVEVRWDVCRGVDSVPVQAAVAYRTAVGISHRCRLLCYRTTPWLQVLGALASVLIVWVVTGILVFEAIQRCIHPEHVDGRRE